MYGTVSDLVTVCNLRLEDSDSLERVDFISFTPKLIYAYRKWPGWVLKPYTKEALQLTLQASGS